MKKTLAKFPALVLILIVGIIAAPSAFASVTIVIENGDAAGVGFNDTTPATPIGGNGGTTLGQQRLIAFQTAASIWGATLNSGPTITVHATWVSLTCTTNSAVLGSAGAATIWHDFPNRPFASTWYGAALANALSGTDLDPSGAEINARFNINLGTTGCLDGSGWYYGLDGNHGSSTDLVAVLIHEFAHGLGFQTYTTASTGVQNQGLPSIYDYFLKDNSTGKIWKDMTDAERAASAINTNNLAWIGPQVTSDAHGLLASPSLKVNSPASIAGNYQVGTADFGPALSSPSITAGVVQALYGAGATDGCSPITNAVSGKIALIDRGTCTFVTKVKNAQAANAIGVLIADNVAGSPPPGLGGSDPTITIPSVRITQADGNTIKAQLASGVNVTLFLDSSVAAGADSSGHPLMFTPNPFQSGSSVSHWDTSAFPNQLMEPNISGDLSHTVTPPKDLTASLLKDIGWATNITTAKTDQTITFGGLSNKTFGDPPFTVSATASSGLPVSFNILSGPATISGNTVTLTGVGTVVVRASQAGDATYNVAPSVDQSFVVATATPTTVQLSATSYSANEGGGFATLTVNRTGDLSAPSTVKYATSDSTDVNFRCDPLTPNQSRGIASRKCDYHIAVGRLRFAAGESTKQILVSIVDDVYPEEPETFTLTLSNPTGAILGTNTTATITIIDDDNGGAANPIDGTRFYVRQLYVDLLSREPDPAGWAGWIHRIDFCGQAGEPPPPCDRVTVGGDGFLRSGEFFDRQFFVLRLYRTGLGRIPKYDEVGDLAYVSGFLSSSDLELNKQELVADIMSRSEFGNKYNGLTNLGFVDALLATAGVTVDQPSHDAWVTALNNSSKSRAQVYREISERQEVSDKYLHEAQVISAYYGFFTRNPDGAYLNFLQRLDSGEINQADLANAFINAAEYRQRFAP
jgi:hypothetical protein